jgi:hypothetical protein
VAVENIPLDYLDVDPEDGTWESVEEEIRRSAANGMPGCLVLKYPLPAEHFKLIK